MLFAKRWCMFKKKNSISSKCFLVISTLLFYACNNTNIEKEQMVKSLADLECRAIEFKNKRFELANQIRFAQDTLLQLKTTSDTLLIQIRLKDWDNQKQLIVNQSLSLADSIKLQMQLIMARYFTDKKNEKEFNILLDAALKKKGCR
jgi:hypothetical protein